MNTMKKTVIALAFLSLASPAYAEWEVALYGGGSFTNNTDIDVTGPFNATLRHAKIDSSGTAGGKLGYWFTGISPHVALGAGVDVFYFRPNISSQTVELQVGGTSAIVGINPINVRTLGIGFDVLKLRVPLLRDEEFVNGRFLPYAGVGPALFVSEFKVSNGTVHDTALGIKAGGGAEFLLTPVVGLFAEYRFTHFTAKVNGSTANYSGDFNTHHITGGVAVHF